MQSGSVHRPDFPGSMCARQCCAVPRLRPLAYSRSTLGLDDGDKAIHGRTLKYLSFARRPADDNAVYPLALTKTEVQAPVVLTRESRSAVDDAALGQISGFDQHLGTDRAAIAARPDEIETNPVIAAVRITAIDQRRLILIRDDYVERAAIGKV